MELSTVIEQLRLLSERGFVPSLRRGPTGVGYTLETALGLRENNFFGPDLDRIELKAHRAKSNNLITLFTFNRKVWQIPPLQAVRQYGSLDRDGRLGLYYTMSRTPNSAGLFLHVDEHSIAVRHIDGTVVAVWQLENLAQRFMQKIPALLFVSAFVEERDGREHFHYYRAQLLEGTSPHLLRHQFLEEHILLDLRLHDAQTRARNHGTGFRVYERNLPNLFQSSRNLL